MRLHPSEIALGVGDERGDLAEDFGALRAATCGPAAPLEGASRRADRARHIIRSGRWHARDALVGGGVHYMECADVDGRALPGAVNVKRP